MILKRKALLAGYRLIDWYNYYVEIVYKKDQLIKIVSVNSNDLNNYNNDNNNKELELEVEDMEDEKLPINMFTFPEIKYKKSFFVCLSSLNMLKKDTLQHNDMKFLCDLHN